MKTLSNLHRLLNLYLFIILIQLTSGCKPAVNTDVRSNNLDTKSSYLPSWTDNETKKAIVDFVSNVTNPNSPDYIIESDRIACFDNDGTLWCEQPMYFQLAFAIDRVKTLAPQHPEWETTQPFKGLLENDMNTVMAGGEHALLEIIMATHAGMTTDEFSQIVKDWIKTAKHPTTGLHYNEMTYKPMTELLEYLRVNGFKTFIVSGGGVDFMRPLTEEAYGIPPYQVVGSSGKVKYEIDNEKATLIKLPQINFIDDKEEKPIGIHQHIGKRPVFTVGNSDGDYAMLKWTVEGPGARFGMLIHHTDSIREYAYDRQSSIGRLNKGLDDAKKYNWQIVDMKLDWKEIYSK